MRLASRYGAPLVALLIAAAVPGIASRFGELRQDPCRAPDALKATSLIAGTTALGERLESLTPETFQWSEGTVTNPVFPELPLRFQIIRSYDGASLYERPVAFAGKKLEPEEREVRELASAGGAIPLHVVRDQTTSPVRLVAYFFVFDGRVVRSPLRAQLQSAVGLALTGPRPVTLVLIAGEATPATAPSVETAATEWLASAWSFVAAACRER